ncbi:MAG TPA: YdcF family protein [Thermoanaerobaculia bacterium]|nr:YdcF family protein [Thermoanaerobaculia bacterium]
MSSARGFALFFALFTILNLLGESRFATANLNLWWIDVWFLPPATRSLAFGILAAALLAFAIAPPWAKRHRAIGATIIGAGAAIAIVNAVAYFRLLARGEIATLAPLPFSALVAAALLVIVIAHYRRGATNRIVFAASAIGAAIVFPLLQFAMFGLTDYRRPADLAVVFGARAYAGGGASPALADRVKEACRVYHAGLAPTLLFSGGPGEGTIDEPHAMQRLALTLGVPSSAIVLDPAGINTEATIRNTAAYVARRPLRVLAVSDFYHLPRIKMTAQRYGLTVFTVPARTSVPRQMVWNVSREAAAFWWYYLKHLGRERADQSVTSVRAATASTT